MNKVTNDQQGHSLEAIERILSAGTPDAVCEMGYISYRRHPDYPGLCVFCYTNDAQRRPVSEWNWVERVCRGLVVDYTGVPKVIGRGFDKFFNWGQEKAHGYMTSVTEKIDGSLGVTYVEPWSGKPAVATKGSFDSPQAIWATGWLRATRLPDVLLDYGLGNRSLIFEIVYPENRVVVDYRGYEGLILLGVRELYDGHEYTDEQISDMSDALGLDRPARYTFNNVTQIIEEAGKLDANKEGYVIRMSSGQRFKIKGDEYLYIHRILSTASFKNVLRAIASGTFDEWTGVLPDHIRRHVDAWAQEIENTVDNTIAEVYSAYVDIPVDVVDGPRGDFARYIQRRYHRRLHGYLFAHLDGKFTKEMVYKREFKDRKNEFAVQDTTSLEDDG